MNFNEHVQGDRLHLYYQKVDIKELISFLQENRGITQLFLGDCSIDEEGVKALAKLTNLTKLDLWNNNIGEEGAKALDELTNLTELNLGSNNIGEEGAKALDELTNLTELNLANNNIDDKGIKALANLTNLTELNLVNNNIDDKGIKALDELTNLTKLNLSYNKIGEEGAKALAKLTNLTELNLANNNIDDKGAKALDELTNLTKLDLSDNNIGAEGVKALAKLTNLIKLNLWNNNIGAEGAKALAKLTNLTELNLGYNKIGDEGVKALANLTKLIRLNLSHNKIGDEGVKALANLTKLIILDLADNNIGDEGAKALVKLTNLTELDFRGNSIGEEGIKALANLTKLIILDLDNNKIGDEGVKALAESEECWEFIDKLVCIGERRSTDYCKRLKASWSQARTKSNGNVGKLDENSVKKLFFDLAQYGHRRKEIELLLNDSDKYPFLINSRNEQGYTLSYFYTRSPEMQEFFFKRGMVPKEERNQRRDDERIAQDNQYDRYLEEEQKDVITKENITPFIENLADRLIQYVKDNPELQEVLQHHLLRIECIDINDPEKVTFKQQKILAEISKYFSENIKGVLPNYNRSIPSRGEYALVIERLSEIKVMERFVQEPSNLQENITRETEAQIDENSDFDAEDNSNSYATISESDTDEEFYDANESIFPEESKTLLVPERLQPENSVIATDQTNGIQNNNRQPSPRIEKKTIVAASTLAIAGVALGVAIAVYLEMLAVGIAVGACCLVAAAIIYCCNSPSNSLKNSDATIVTNERHLEA